MQVGATGHSEVVTRRAPGERLTRGYRTPLARVVYGGGDARAPNYRNRVEGERKKMHARG